MTEIEVCPHCDSSKLMVNSSGGMSGPDREAKGKWQCNDCLKFCDDPPSREAKGHRKGGDALPNKLLNADPDEWP